MATLLAVEWSGGTASLVKAELAKGEITLTGSRTFEFVDGENEPSRESQFSTALSDFVAGVEVDAALALIDSSRIVSSTISLPFRDQKRIDQTASIQLEDLLPFDVDGYVVDSYVVRRDESGAYQVLSTLAPREEVVRFISTLKSLGVEPHVVTTRASSLGALSKRFATQVQGTDCLLLGFHRDGCSCALIENGVVSDLREVLLPSSRPDFRVAIRDVQLLLLREEARRGRGFEQIFVVGVEDSAVPVLSEIFGRPVVRLRLSDVVQSRGVAPEEVEKLTSAVGLFSGYEDRSRLVDFRKGDLSYKATWNQIRTAVQDYAAYLVWALVLIVGWYVASLYSSHRVLGRIDGAIESSVAKVLPGVSLRRGQELPEIRSRVEALEAELQGMGSLTALSPLELLRSLSETVNPELDVAFETINISPGGFTFSGSVGGNVMIGRLAGVLEAQSQKFCEVKVDPKGRVPGANRVRFLADVQLCVQP